MDDEAKEQALNTPSKGGTEGEDDTGDVKTSNENLSTEEAHDVNLGSGPIPDATNDQEISQGTYQAIGEEEHGDTPNPQSIKGPRKLIEISSDDMGTSSAIHPSLGKKAQSPLPPSLFSFNIRDYIEEGKVSSSAPKTHQEEIALSAATKDQLQLMLPHLEKDTADLAPKVIRAKQRLAGREAQNNLNAHEESTK
ncbi:uncharacterized protein [Miscanthus floridulus]|uniref:uncharacterized protein isoform X2 n=1 Tax=Miscanthus floridulus TaxID=154761 RepID=UPI003458D71A